MARIIGVVESPGPNIPIQLSRKFHIRATYPLNEVEANLFTQALQGVVAQMEYESIDYTNLSPVVALVTESGSFSYEEFEEEDNMAFRITFLIFCVKKWRGRGFTDLNILTCFLEELCHHFWNIFDEEEVKYKVLEIANRIFDNQLLFSDLYNTKWKESYPHLYGDKS